jgi:hypothetical protein
MAPVFALVIQPLVQHLHNLDKVSSVAQINWLIQASPMAKQTDSLIIRQLRNLVHLGARWAPGIVRRGISDFGLGI